MKLILELNRTISMLMAHPDNMPNSEFADRIDSLENLRDSLENLIDSFKKKQKKTCNDCGDFGWIYDKQKGTRKICPCHY